MADSRTLVYDDGCGFCTDSALYLARGTEMELIPFSEVESDTLDRLPTDWRECAHLLTDGGVYSCGEAMERAYELSDGPGAFLIKYLRYLPGYGLVREGVYSRIAENRALVSNVVRRVSNVRSL